MSAGNIFSSGESRRQKQSMKYPESEENESMKAEERKQKTIKLKMDENGLNQIKEENINVNMSMKAISENIYQSNV